MASIDSMAAPDSTDSAGSPRTAGSAGSAAAPETSLEAVDSARPAPTRLALVQMAPSLGDRQRNLTLHLERIDEARRQGAHLIVFPELSLTGYFLRDMVPDVALSPTSDELARLIEAAGPASLTLGFVEESSHHRYYNTAVYAEAGRILHLHRKVYLPTYGLFDERRYFAPGDQFRAFDSAQLGRVGLLICEDFWHISALALMQAEEVDLLLCLSNSPARGVDAPRLRTAESYERFCRTYAELLGAVVVFVNRTGFEDGVCFWGGSMVVGPDAELLAQGPLFDEALVLADLDRADLRRRRIRTPLSRDEQLLLTVEEFLRIKRRRYET